MTPEINRISQLIRFLQHHSTLVLDTTIRWVTAILTWPRTVKRSIVLGLDVVLCVFSVWLAFCLSLGRLVAPADIVVIPILTSIALALPIFWAANLYRTIFRYSGIPVMVAIARAMLLYGLIFVGIFTFIGVNGVPRTLGIIQPILLLVLIGTTRAAARIWLGNQQSRTAALPQALIYGAGSAGRQLASALASSPEIQVVGFMDDDVRLHGHVLNGLPIHNPASLAEVLRISPVTDVLLALPRISRQRRNEILNDLKPHRVAVRTLPGLSDMAIGKVSLDDIRELDIDDLLGRESVEPDKTLLAQNTYGKTVLVTGAGGSIGSELCRQILKNQPKCLLLVEMSEFALYQIHQELQALLADMSSYAEQAEGAIDSAFSWRHHSSSPTIEVIPLLASVCDSVRITEIMQTWRPHTVYHAAAYKHVPLVEHNPVEGIRNNVWGTKVCAEAAIQSGVSHFVLISTDKAVRPTNIMGATKRLAEMVLQALAETQQIQNTSTPPTTFCMVRFGNVLGSSGSVVPLFRKQIRNGGPITLTHADITRYFMTIPEAAQLVIQAGALGHGGDVFVLDMGQPVRIIDLAYRMVELSGLTIRDEQHPDGDIALAITGLRPGEKLYEELLIGDNPQPTQHPRIMKAHEHFLPLPQLEEKLDGIHHAMYKGNISALCSLLQQTVNEYQPSGNVVDWVHMAHNYLQH